MKALLDTNFLIALFDAAHVHHATAQAWLIENRRLGWATCPLTQNGYIRIFSHPAYPSSLPVPGIARRLRQATAAADREFWADAVSLTDPKRFDLTRAPHPRYLTDAYLLGLAVDLKARLQTFGQGIPAGAVRGAAGKGFWCCKRVASIRSRASGFDLFRNSQFARHAPTALLARSSRLRRDRKAPRVGGITFHDRKGQTTKPGYADLRERSWQKSNYRLTKQFGSARCVSLPGPAFYCLNSLGRIGKTNRGG